MRQDTLLENSIRMSLGGSSEPGCIADTNDDTGIASSSPLGLKLLSGLHSLSSPSFSPLSHNDTVTLSQDDVSFAIESYDCASEYSNASSASSATLTPISSSPPSPIRGSPRTQQSPSSPTGSELAVYQKLMECGENEVVSVVIPGDDSSDSSLSYSGGETLLLNDSNNNDNIKAKKNSSMDSVSIADRAEGTTSAVRNSRRRPSSRKSTLPTISELSEMQVKVLSAIRVSIIYYRRVDDKHAVYGIRVNIGNQKSWILERRYSDFYLLREELVKAFRHVLPPSDLALLPPMPAKTWSWPYSPNLESTFLKMRGKGLGLFLKDLTFYCAAG
jgi:hypothetical protein